MFWDLKTLTFEKATGVVPLKLFESSLSVSRRAGVPSGANVTTANYSIQSNVRFFDIVLNSKTAVEPYSCVNLSVQIVENTTICIYDPATDIWVSGFIVKYGAWETDLVQNTIRILKQNPGMQFLDIGVNIGVHTIPVAKFGRRVVAIDANKRNLELVSKSLVLGGLQDQVILIWNAVSDKIENVSLQFAHRNIGGTSVKSLGGDSVSEDKTATTITLNNITSIFQGKTIFMKMDIESYEWHALQGANEFLKAVNVSHIQMEIAQHMTTSIGEKIVNYLTERSYLPCNPKSFPPIALKLDDRGNWPGDVMWIKSA